MRASVAGRALIPVLIAALTLQGCASTRFDPATGLYAEPVGGAPATANPTPLTPALLCLAESGRTRGLVPPRLAVGEIADLTGKLDLETGRRITQGAALFAVTAFGRAGVPLVERSDEAVPQVERAYAAARVLSDSPTGPGEDPGPVRVVNPGQIAGSRYYLVGGVTELNYNIESSGGEIGVGALDPEDVKTGIGGSRFVMNVAVDLRLVDSISQEVVAVAAYQKQIVGREIRAGVFDIMGGIAVDLSGGVSALEPLQLGVRALIEQGVYDIAADLYGLTDSGCLAPDLGAGAAGGYSRLRALAPAAPAAPAAPTVLATVVVPRTGAGAEPAGTPFALATTPAPAGQVTRIDPRSWRLARPVRP